MRINAPRGHAVGWSAAITARTLMHAVETKLAVREYYELTKINFWEKHRHAARLIMADRGLTMKIGKCDYPITSPVTVFLDACRAIDKRDYWFVSRFAMQISKIARHTRNLSETRPIRVSKAQWDIIRAIANRVREAECAP